MFKMRKDFLLVFNLVLLDFDFEVRVLALLSFGGFDDRLRVWCGDCMGRKMISWS